MPTPPQTLSDRLRGIAKRFIAFDPISHESKRLIDEAAAELDRRDALVTAAEAWAQVVRNIGGNEGRFSEEDALLALLPLPEASKD